MGKDVKKAILSKVTRFETDWVEHNDNALVCEEEIRINTLIVLRIRQYMKSHGMKQNELAKKLGTTPQYVNKLLHGQDHNLSIKTAVRYGRLLGIKLIEVPNLSDRTEQQHAFGSKTIRVEVPSTGRIYPAMSNVSNFRINNKRNSYGCSVS